MQAKQTIIFSCKTWNQDREFKSESILSPAYNIAKEEFPFTKFKITNNTYDEKTTFITI